MAHAVRDGLRAQLSIALTCSAKAIVSKIALDQVLMAPIGTCLFYIVTSVLQGETSQVPAKLKEKFIPTVIASYTLWPAAHAINFKFVPSSQRILYTNIVSVSLPDTDDSTPFHQHSVGWLS